MGTSDLGKSLCADVKEICPPKGRMVGSAGHLQARNFLINRLVGLGLLPYSGQSFDLTYSRDGQDFHNLIGVIPCGDPTLPPVLIGAHYDSYLAAPSADDNAAAVAIALAAAKELMSLQLNRNIIVALFDAEEPPYFLGESMGSIRFYKDQRQNEGVHAAIIMDLVGHDVTLPIPNADKVLPGIKNLICLTGAESHPAVADIVSRQDFGDLVPVATLNSNIGDMSDHHIFRTHGVPYLFLTCGRWRCYHDPCDTPALLNCTKMAHIVRLLVDLTVKLANTPLPRALPPDAPPPIDSAQTGGRKKIPPGGTGGQAASDPTLALEIRLIRAAFGPLLPTVLGAVGLRHLSTRSDVNTLVSALQAMM